jgi:hypothetical protein
MRAPSSDLRCSRTSCAAHSSSTASLLVIVVYALLASRGHSGVTNADSLGAYDAFSFSRALSIISL